MTKILPIEENPRDFNIVILNENLLTKDIPLLFGEETVNMISPDVDMFQLLVDIGLFQSRSDAKRNWNKSGREIPNGFSEFKLSKGGRLTIWNPTQKEEEET